MKTRIKLLAAAVGMMSVVTSCSNEAVESEVAGSTMLEAEISGIANTRAAIEGTTLPEGSNYGLYVFEDYKAVSGNIKMEANSTATGYELAAGKEVKVVAYYPYNEKGVEGEDMVLIYPGNTDYLHTISSEVYTKSNPKAFITLHHAMARVKFNIKLAEDFAGSCSVVFNSLDNVFTQGYMRLGIDGGSAYGSYGSLETLKLENPIKDEIKVGTTLSTEMLLVPQDLNYYKPVVKVEIDSKSKDISADVIKATASANWESGKVYTYNITISEGAKVSISSATIEEWGEAETLPEVIIVDSKVDSNGHEYVDLGLPSGTLWATCNVGAKSPEEYGDYFAWGETKARDNFTEENYSYSDKPAILPLDADAAFINWGEGWRMPTYEELEELRTACDWTPATINGKKGSKVSSKKNSNYIFMPWAGMYGFFNEPYFVGGGEMGFYWTSTLYRESFSWYIGLYEYPPYIEPQDCYNGLSVRPVYKK